MDIHRLEPVIPLVWNLSKNRKASLARAAVIARTVTSIVLRILQVF